MQARAAAPESGIVCQDWRTLPAVLVRALIDNEVSAWRRELSWDVRDSWRVIEPARAAGALPGFVAFSADGDVAGWTWFLNHHGCLQVAAVVAEDSDTVRALVDAIQCSSEAAVCREQIWSVRGEPAGLRRALEAYGLRVAPYLYLQGRIDGAGPATALIPGSRLLASSDIPRLGALFAGAYEGSDAVRAFATDGSANGWESYLRTLLESDGCGTMLPYASLVLETAGVLQGAVICSSIDREARVTHLGQIAVHPGARGRGAGRTLLESAITRCAAAGSKEMTLLVAEANLPARRLYESLGFTEVARFTVAATS